MEDNLKNKTPKAERRPKKSALFSMITLIVKNSNISGIGLFSEYLIKEGSVMFPLFYLTPDAKYSSQIEPANFINHSIDSNIKTVIMHSKIAYAVASKNIFNGDELSINYFDLQKWNVPTMIEDILKSPDQFQKRYDANRHKLKCNKPLGHRYFI